MRTLTEISEGFMTIKGRSRGAARRPTIFGRAADIGEPAQGAPDEKITQPAELAGG
jgi:hypothetical protein